MEKNYKIILVEDDKKDGIKIIAILKEFAKCKIDWLKNPIEANEFISQVNINNYNLAIIDVKLTKLRYDQSGLGVLDLLKRKDKKLPVLILTAHAYDYPSLRNVSERYWKMNTYEKSTFYKDPSSILNNKLAELPEEIGDDNDEISYFNPTSVTPEHRPADYIPGHFSRIVYGFVVLSVVLVTFFVYTLIIRLMPDNSLGIAIFTGIIALATLSFLIYYFGSKVVSKAFKIYRGIRKTLPVESEENE